MTSKSRKNLCHKQSVLYVWQSCYWFFLKFLLKKSIIWILKIFLGKKFGVKNFWEKNLKLTQVWEYMYIHHPYPAGWRIPVPRDHFEFVNSILDRRWENLSILLDVDSKLISTAEPFSSLEGHWSVDGCGGTKNTGYRLLQWCHSSYCDSGECCTNVNPTHSKIKHFSLRKRFSKRPSRPIYRTYVYRVYGSARSSGKPHTQAKCFIWE